MIPLHEDYVIDEKGKKKSVILPYQEWEIIIEELEELEDIRCYDKIKKQSSDSIPFDEAINEIRKGK